MKKDDVNYLLSKGYKISKHKSLLTNKEEEFLLQPRHNETITHLFCTYDIAEYLESKGIKVEKYVTRKPDLVFQIGKKKFAIEVETGSMLTRKKALEERKEYLKKNYNEWLFVVTNRNKVKDYKKYGKSVDLRVVRRELDKILNSHST
jgi:hypothetical protein